jgi:cell division protein FtsZ
MIPYHRNPQQTLPSSSVKIIGLGGAGVNMLERVALDGTEGAELLALNTDVRTLAACVASEKIQLGRNLTKGLGAGGDPELGHQAMLEAEAEIRAALRGRRIVFLCVGLGGGTGSGAAPMITRIAREEGAFVVVFATMPFAFEGRRRREQAETTLNELAVLSNALVTFDNNRMGELVLAKQGIHEAFAAADHMVCESIKAVIRLVIRPGLINIGLDDLMSALRTNRSRCLFGSGLAKGKDRASCALRNALASPLLDQGALLKEAQTVLVHLSGGEDLTLYEVELLMQRLQKFVPESAHVLFGAVIDPAMGDSLSVTLISALPEDSLAAAPRDSVSSAAEKSPLDPSESFTTETPSPAPASVPAPARTKSLDPETAQSPLKARHEPTQAVAVAPPPLFNDKAALSEPAPAPIASAIHTAVQAESGTPPRLEPVPASSEASERADKPAPFGQPYVFKPVARTANPSKNTWGKPNPPASGGSGDPNAASSDSNAHPDPFVSALDPAPESETPKLKLGVKSQAPQNELAFDSTPRGRFEGQTPNVVDGEDLDLPPFLRKKK